MSELSNFWFSCLFCVFLLVLFIDILYLLIFTKSIDEIFKNLIITIEKTVNDEKIREESTQNIDNIYSEFKESLEEIQNKLKEI